MRRKQIQKSKAELSDEAVAYFRSLPEEELSWYMVRDFASDFADAKQAMNLELVPKIYIVSFFNGFNRLKRYKKQFGWERGKIRSEIGVDFNEAKKLYYELQSKVKNAPVIWCPLEGSPKSRFAHYKFSAV